MRRHLSFYNKPGTTQQPVIFDVHVACCCIGLWLTHVPRGLPSSLVNSFTSDFRCRYSPAYLPANHQPHGAQHSPVWSASESTTLVCALHSVFFLTSPVAYYFTLFLAAPVALMFLPCYLHFTSSKAHSRHIVPMHPTSRRVVCLSLIPSSRCRYRLRPLM